MEVTKVKPNNARNKVIQETGTPALLYFKPEERPTDCRITSFIKMIRIYGSSKYLNLSFSNGEKNE